MPEKEQEINIKLKIILFFQKNDRINFVAFFSIRDFFLIELDMLSEKNSTIEERRYPCNQIKFYFGIRCYSLFSFHLNIISMSDVFNKINGSNVNSI